jgi:hypothetical protein
MEEFVHPLDLRAKEVVEGGIAEAPHNLIDVDEDRVVVADTQASALRDARGGGEVNHGWFVIDIVGVEEGIAEGLEVATLFVDGAVLTSDDDGAAGTTQQVDGADLFEAEVVPVDVARALTGDAEAD